MLPVCYHTLLLLPLLCTLPGNYEFTYCTYCTLFMYLIFVITFLVSKSSFKGVKERYSLNCTVICYMYLFCSLTLRLYKIYFSFLLLDTRGVGGGAGVADSPAAPPQGQEICLPHRWKEVNMHHIAFLITNNFDNLSGSWCPLGRRWCSLPPWLSPWSGDTQCSHSERRQCIQCRGWARCLPRIWANRMI